MIPLLVQVSLFVLLIEGTLWCLPRAWRRASQSNCLRPNGTRSPNRTSLERQAYHRLRLELAAPLLLIFLTGNALYQTVDKTVVSMSTLVSTLNSSVGLAVTSKPPTDGVSTSVITRVAVFTLLWIVFSVLIGGWTLVFAFRNFAAGVRDRSHEYSQFDMTRGESVTTAPKKPKSNHPQGSDVA